MLTIAHMEAPIPIVVLGGYLGAGKTTLLNELLADSGQRIGVVVNDFGELGIDAALLADAADDGLIDLPNGCVCCTLGTELGVALESLAARRPRLDRIVIEASGVADPAALAAWGTVPGFSPGGVFVLAAADSIRRLAADRYVGGEVERQLSAADVIIVTKRDLVVDERFDEVVRWLGARGVPVIERPTSMSELVVGADPHRPRTPTAASVHGTDYVRWSWAAEHEATPTEAGVRLFVEALPDSALRAKGIVSASHESGASRLIEIQVVGRTRALAASDREDGASSRSDEGIVVIGVEGQLDVGELDRLARRHLAPRA